MHLECTARVKGENVVIILYAFLNIFADPVKKVVSRFRSQNTYSENKLKDDSPPDWIIIYLLSLHRQAIALNF